MLLFILILIIFIVLYFAELKPLYEKDAKTFRVYACVAAAALILWALVAYGVRVPGPSEPIKNAVDSILGQR